MEEDDEICPRCKSTKYRNRNLQLMVNECGHPLCQNCVESLFAKGSGACPVCSITLRKGNFIVQLFGDPLVEKDNLIRKKILKIYNKWDEDFDDLREYNDYLEEVETIIFNLVRNIDVENTKLRIEQYKKENKDMIHKNKGRMCKEEMNLKYMVEMEKELKESRMVELQQEEKNIKIAKDSKKQNLLKSLITSNLPASQLIEEYKQASKEIDKPLIPPKPLNQFSTGVSFAKNQMYLPVPKKNLMNYTYQFQEEDVVGPTYLNPEHFNSYGFLKNVRSALDHHIGGGFVSEYACGRALDDAYSTLYDIII